MVLIAFASSRRLNFREMLFGAKAVRPLKQPHSQGCHDWLRHLVKYRIDSASTGEANDSQASLENVKWQLGSLTLPSIPHLVWR